MKRIAILGSTGMIGSGVTQGLSNSGYAITEFNRSGRAVRGENEAHQFNVSTENLRSQIASLSDFDYILNFVGLIRHKINPSQVKSIGDAQLLNIFLPTELNQLAQKNNCRIFQIGTDCVFSGNAGKYDELSPHDPSDVYGQTKSKGEEQLSQTMNLRVSIVGKELYSNIELMNWLLHQPLNAEVQGFVNHFWNGVTPKQLSRVISSIITNDLFTPKTLHLVPSNSISKFELLQTIATFGGRKDLLIRPVAAELFTDRTLSTHFPEWNKQLWESAGYLEIPRIQDMIAEYMD